MFCALPQNNQHLFEKEKKNACYSKLSKELKISIKIEVGQAVLIDQNNILTVLIHNLKTAWPTRISMPFLSSFDNLF